MSLEQLFSGAVARVNDQRGKPAILGKTDGTLYWTDANGLTHRTRVWARVGEEASRQEVVVDCLAVSPQIGMPVRVDYVNGAMTVIDVDSKRAVEFSGGRPGAKTGAHAWTHSRLGPDPDYVEGLRYLPLAATPTNPPDLTVTVRSGAYSWGGALQIFDEAASGSLSSYVPGSGHHFVIICLDRPNDQIVIVDGADVTAEDVVFGDVSVSASDIEAVSINSNYLPLAVVLLYAGQTEIKARDITNDLRTGGSGGDGVSALDDLSDVTITSASDNDLLTYDSGTGEWVNTADPTIDSLTFAPAQTNITGGGQINFNPGGSLRSYMTDTQYALNPLFVASFEFAVYGKTATPLISADANTEIVTFEGSTATELLVVNAGDDAVYIGTTTAGAIAQFKPTEIVFNNEEADRNLRIAGSGVTNGYFYDAGNNRHGFGIGTPENTLAIVLGAGGGILSSDVLTDATAKDTRFLLRHYTNSEEAFVCFGGASNSGRNEGRFGGGYGVQNSATHLRFFAAANTTTLSGTEVMTMTSTGLGIGTGISGPATSAALEISSTVGAVLLPRMTTTQRNALTPTNGMIIYNTTNNVIEGYENGSWVNL